MKLKTKREPFEDHVNMRMQKSQMIMTSLWWHNKHSLQAQTAVFFSLLWRQAHTDGHVLRVGQSETGETCVFPVISGVWWYCWCYLLLSTKFPVCVREWQLYFHTYLFLNRNIFQLLAASLWLKFNREAKHLPCAFLHLCKYVLHIT